MPWLSMLNHLGDCRLELGLHESQPAFLMSDESGTPRLVAYLDPQVSPSIELRDAAGVSRAYMALDEEGVPWICLEDSEDVRRAALGLSGTGEPCLALNDEDGRSRVLLAHGTDWDMSGLMIKDGLGVTRLVMQSGFQRGISVHDSEGTRRAFFGLRSEDGEIQTLTSSQVSLEFIEGDDGEHRFIRFLDDEGNWRVGGVLMETQQTVGSETETTVRCLVPTEQIPVMELLDENGFPIEAIGSEDWSEVSSQMEVLADMSSTELINLWSEVVPASEEMTALDMMTILRMAERE